MSTSMKINFGRILEVEPAPISCMSLNHRKKKLALFRGGGQGVIEIWDVEHQPVLQKRILQLEKIEGNASVESIIWVQDRLFSCGLHGFVLEHQISSGLIKGKFAATSGPVWCLAVNPSLTVIAAGTEDGFVNLFQIDASGLNYLKVLDRQEGRVLCIQWSVCGRFIGTGSIDSVRLWDVEKGHAVQRLTTGRTKNKETIVWSLLILEDLTIVSGDSRGIISFWDGRIGVLKFKIQSHKADVLSLRLSEDKSSIYAAGVDPIVLILTKLGGNDKWVKSHPRNIHVNDVLCLELLGNRLFSGGIDSDLAMSSFPPKLITKYPPVPKSNNISYSKESSRMLVANSKSLDLWKLPDNNSNSQQQLTKLAQIKTKNEEENIFSSCLSPCGSTIAYSTLTSLKILKLQEKIQNLKLSKKPNANQFHLQFINANTIFLINPTGNEAAFVKIQQDSDEVAEWIEIEDFEPIDDTDFGVTSLAASSNNNGEEFLAITHDRKITIYKVEEENNLKLHSKIPTANSNPITVQFHPNKKIILTAYADHLIQLYDFSIGKIIFQDKIKKKSDDLQPIQGAAWNSRGNSLILYQLDSLVMLEMNLNDEEPTTKKSRKLITTEKETCYSFNYKSTCAAATKFKYLVHISANDDDEFVAVEVDPNSIIEKLPPAFSKKRFGA